MAELVEGVADFLVVEWVGLWVRVGGVGLGGVPAFAPLVGVLVGDGVGVAIGGVKERFVGGIGPTVEGASLAGVEGSADPFGEGLLGRGGAPSVGVGVQCVGVIGEEGEAGASVAVVEFAVGDEVRNVFEPAEEG